MPLWWMPCLGTPKSSGQFFFNAHMPDFKTVVWFLCRCHQHRLRSNMPTNAHAIYPRIKHRRMRLWTRNCRTRTTKFHWTILLVHSTKTEPVRSSTRKHGRTKHQRYVWNHIQHTICRRSLQPYVHDIETKTECTQSVSWLVLQTHKVCTTMQR